MIGRRRHHFSASTALATVIAGSATVVFAVLPAPRASAQESGTQASKIEEVVVTARRRDESLLRVPATIQALTGKELASQSINTEADLQRAVPGLVIRESLSSNQLNYSIRGQSVDAFSSSSPGVLSYFNEFQATATSASGLYDLQSIQVVKGPQGTLYGRNTTGGAVLYTTAKPTDEFAAGLNVKLGDYAMRSAEGFVSTPLAGDKAQLRIAGKMLKRDGFQDNEYNGKEIGSADYTSGRISLVLRPVEGLENSTMFQYEETGGENVGSSLYNVAACAGPTYASCIYQPAVPFWGAYTAAHPEVFSGGIVAFDQLQRRKGPYKLNLNSDLSHDGKQKLLTNTTTWELSPTLTLKNVAGWVDSDSEDSTDVDGTPYAIYANGLYDSNERTVFGNEQYSEELQLQGTANDGDIEYLVGIYYGHEEKTFYIPTAFFDLRPIVPDVPRADKDNIQKSENWGIFGHVSYDLGEMTGADGLKLTAGYRYTKEEVEAKHLPRSLFYQLGISPEGLDAKFDEPSWNVGLEYQATDDVFLYLVQRGSWRSGGFNTNSQLFPGTIDVGGAEFLPEKTKDVEAGIKYNGLMGEVPVQLNLALYKQWVDDIQRVVYVNLPLFGPTALTANVPKTEIQGFELGGQVRPSEFFTVGFNVVYTDAEFTKNDVTLFGVTTAFGPFPDTPEWSGSLYAEIGFPIDPALGELSFRADLYTQSKFYYSSLNNTTNPGSELPDYDLANFRLDWDGINGSKFGASAFITNAFDKTYYTGGLALGSVLGLNAAIPGMPRMYGVEVRMSY